MKKIIFTTVFIFTALLTQAQFENCDINIRKHIRNATINTIAMIPVLAQGDVAKMKLLTEQCGGLFKYAAGDVVSIAIPQNKLAVFAGNTFVSRMESRTPKIFALDDTMRVNNNINEIQQGLPPLTQGYDGTGVVAGFIDAGIDFTHPDFRDSLNLTRVAWLWDQSKPVAANTPMPFGYGQDWDNTAIDAGQCTQNTGLEYGHGSFSAGITAGNGRATGFNKGCAPKADIIVVNYDFATNQPQPNAIADGINYIFNKADAMNKPCVVNLSLGDLYGSFDGKDLEAVAIDNMLKAKPGRLAVAANGNWGGNKSHLTYNVTSDTSWTWFKYDPNFQQLYIEVYGDSADMVNMSFAFGADANTTSASYLGRTVYRKVTNIPMNGSFNLVPGVPGDTVFYNVDKFNGVYQLVVNIITQNPGYYWRFMTTGSGKFGLRNYTFVSGYPSGMVFDNLPAAAIVPDIIYYQLPDSLSNLSSSFNCLESVISVGNIVNRNSNYDCQNILRFNPVSPVGYLAPNSSAGPTRTGLQKPDISATGNYTMAPLPLIFANDPAWQLLPKINAGCYHYVAGGTSAAAPVVAGVGALFLQKNPNATPALFKQYIICGARQDSATGSNLPDYKWGYGKVNGFATMTNCFAGINDFTASMVYTSVQPNPFSTITKLRLYPLPSGTKNLELQVVDVLGKKAIENKNGFVVTGSEATIEVNANTLKAGIYFFSIYADGVLISKGKLMVE